MKDITPVAMRCQRPIHFTCPSLFEVTPEEMRCTEAAMCPALIAEVPDAPDVSAACFGPTECPALIEETVPGTNDLFPEGGVWVIGKRAVIPDEVKARIGIDEAAVLVPKGLLKNIQWAE